MEAEPFSGVTVPLDVEAIAADPVEASERGVELFAGSERGADRAAAVATLIMTAKLNDVDPQAWLADVLARINDHAIQRLAELLPWNWRKPMPSHIERA